MNPFLQARYFHEVLLDPEAAMQHLNRELGKIIGDDPFHSFDKERMAEAKQAGFRNCLENLIGYHLYHQEAFGVSDYLNVPYGKAWSALWEMFPQREWLNKLASKDFRVPSVDQLYIDPVPKSEYGDRESPAIVQAALQKSMDSGILWIGHGYWRPFGIVHYNPELILEGQSRALAGLREWWMTKAASFQVPCTQKTVTEFWEQQWQARPDWILERGMDLLSYSPGLPNLTRRNWELTTVDLGFWKVLARALEQALMQDNETKTTVAEYARIPLHFHHKSAEFLADLLRLVQREITIKDFCNRWLADC